MKEHSTMSIEHKVLKRIKGFAPDAVFTRSDFVDLGSTHAVGMVFQRLLKLGRLRRVARGLYDVPRQHPALGELSPRPNAIAQALARRDGVRLQATEAQAANELNLSEQVPARLVYDTDGRPRSVRVGGVSLEFRGRSKRKMAAAGRGSGLVMAALRALGPKHIETRHIEHLRELLPSDERSRLMKVLRYAPAWMHPHLRQIAAAQL
jgi:hypothetical protein